jgi:hypothetical protein
MNICGHSRFFSRKYAANQSRGINDGLNLVNQPLPSGGRVSPEYTPGGYDHKMSVALQMLQRTLDL